MEKKKILILYNHNKEKIIGTIELQENIPFDYNQEMFLDPAFIKNEDGSLELLEVSLCFNKKTLFGCKIKMDKSLSKDEFILKSTYNQCYTNK